MTDRQKWAALAALALASGAMCYWLAPEATVAVGIIAALIGSNLLVGSWLGKTIQAAMGEREPETPDDLRMVDWSEAPARPGVDYDPSRRYEIPRLL